MNKSAAGEEKTIWSNNRNDCHPSWKNGEFVRIEQNIMESKRTDNRAEKIKKFKAKLNRLKYTRI